MVASLLREVIDGILRTSFGHDGVEVTGCIEMETVAAREGDIPAATIDALALQAGAELAHDMPSHRPSKGCPRSGAQCNAEWGP
ncbi:hypothetical protein BC827DRAFT_1186669 [Russula dissimulans]|nr:hypothetical protein BC827DRAFT_1186669 [Russula dissimulans]